MLVGKGGCGKRGTLFPVAEVFGRFGVADLGCSKCIITVRFDGSGSLGVTPCFIIRDHEWVAKNGRSSG